MLTGSCAFLMASHYCAKFESYNDFDHYELLKLFNFIWYAPVEFSTTFCFSFVQIQFSVHLK